jgi:hypothetical protein
MAHEYLCAGDCASALRLFRSVAAVYRREGWDALLAGTLSSLRECAGRLSMHSEHLAWSLELGSLHADSGAPLPERTAVLSAALATVRARDDASEADITRVTVTEVRPLPAVGRFVRLLTRPPSICPTHQTCVRCLGGFSRATAPAGSAVPFNVALLPLMFTPLHLHGLALELQGDGAESVTVSLSPADAGPVAPLAPRSWAMFSASATAPRNGKLCATAILLHISPHATLRCPLAEASAPVDADPLAPADPLTVGAAHVVRRGGVVGQLSVSGTAAIPSAKVDVSSAAQALAGQVVRIEVTVSALVRCARGLSHGAASNSACSITLSTVLCCSTSG